VALNVQGWRVDDVTVVEDEYGILGNQTIKRYTFSNANGVTAEIITYGGRITAIKVPDICGEIRDVVLGFDNLEGLYSYLVTFVVYLATLYRLPNK
jgi:galactose mutarotase-like enzyme